MNNIYDLLEIIKDCPIVFFAKQRNSIVWMSEYECYEPKRMILWNESCTFRVFNVYSDGNWDESELEE